MSAGIKGTLRIDLSNVSHVKKVSSQSPFFHSPFFVRNDDYDAQPSESGERMGKRRIVIRHREVYEFQSFRNVMSKQCFSRNDSSLNC